MQSFGISNDLPSGTPSIFTDDEAYNEPTELDWLMWQLHGDPRLEAGMAEDDVRRIAPEIIETLLNANQ